MLYGILWHFYDIWVNMGIFGSTTVQYKPYIRDFGSKKFQNSKKIAKKEPFLAIFGEKN